MLSGRGETGNIFPKTLNSPQQYHKRKEQGRQAINEINTYKHIFQAIYIKHMYCCTFCKSLYHRQLM